jgi:phage terminase large subunit-like protein
MFEVLDTIHIIAQEFITRWIKENGEHAVEKVIQGAKTESVPLGELKKLSEERLLLFDQELFRFTMGNCVTMRTLMAIENFLKNTGKRKLTLSLHYWMHMYRIS